MSYTPVAVQNPDATRAAIALFKKGTPPDGQPWHGPKPSVSVDYVGCTVPMFKQAENADGSTTFALMVHFGTGTSGGFYSDSILFQRFLTAYPNGEGTLRAQFKHAINENVSQFQDGIRNWLNERPAQVLAALLGREAYVEWDKYDTLKVDMDSLTPIGDVQFRRELRQPFSIKVAVKATRRKALVGPGPFSRMSDKELDVVLARYEQEAPENFWQDGELNLGRTEAYTMYRNRYRKLSPRLQQDMLDRLGGY